MILNRIDLQEVIIVNLELIFIDAGKIPSKKKCPDKDFLSIVSTSSLVLKKL
jgi:hypothetical protein